MRWGNLLMLIGWLAGLPAAATRGQDNPIGLPVATEGGRPGAVVLHGGGELSDDVFERFIELAGGKEARIILVPSAGYRHSDYENEQQFLRVMRERFSGWVRLASTGHIRSFDFLYTDDPTDADAAAFVRPLETATGVWFCGGLQPRLNYRFVGEFPEKTRFQQALREVVARGGVVGGTSAGMAALPEIMTLYQDRKHEHARPPAWPRMVWDCLTARSSSSTSTARAAGWNASPVCCAIRSSSRRSRGARRGNEHGGAGSRRVYGAGAVRQPIGNDRLGQRMCFSRGLPAGPWSGTS